MIIFISFMETEDNIRPTIRNKENRKEVSLNDNEHDKQSKEDLKKFKERVQEIIENPYDSFFISQICLTTNKHLSKYEDLAKISDTISKIIKDNPDLACNIINGFAQGYIPEENDLVEISNIISQIIQTDGIKDKPELAHNIINGFAEACISREKDLRIIDDAISKINEKNGGSDLVNNNELIKSILVLHKAISPTSDYFSNDEDLTEVCNAISKIAKTNIVEYNPNFMPNIVSTLTQTCISKGTDLKKICDAISGVIKDNPDLACKIINGFTRGCISAETDLKKIGDAISGVIKKNPDLDYKNVINGFTQGCISEGADLKKIGDAISSCISEEKNLTKIGYVISGVIKENPYYYADKIISGFTQGCISKGKNFTGIGYVISVVIKENPYYCADDEIISGFTQGCISKGKNLAEISDIISKIIQTDGIKDNPDSALGIINGFTQGCISKGENLTDISGVISKIVKDNPDSALNIVCGFTQGCISKGKNLAEISDIISKIIQTDRIKDNPDLVFNIINGFVQGCLTTKSDNIKEIAEGFSNSLNGMEDKIKDKLKPIFSLIVSQYFMNTLTNSSNKQLSEEDKEQTETQLFECYKKLFHVEDKQGFQDIPLKELSDLQDEYLKEKFKKKGVNNGREYETFLKMAYNLMSKSEGNKELTVTDLKKQKDAFKDLKFIKLRNSDNIQLKKELFEKSD